MFILKGLRRASWDASYNLLMALVKRTHRRRQIGTCTRRISHTPRERELTTVADGPSRLAPFDDLRLPLLICQQRATAGIVLRQIATIATGVDDVAYLFVNRGYIKIQDKTFILLRQTKFAIFVNCYFLFAWQPVDAVSEEITVLRGDPLLHFGH
ncbi:hypothetical protein QR680_019362 [Steinernema hermaphroditum]|uniref:Uncharacterized protein n=1 Tax=Steinernema hermaphroditum TaxID=289476 RepID=A0AA39GN67_9BILA|nr:hypothetical protein QR680_019362 [Steinernema hermaphroditum]